MPWERRLPVFSLIRAAEGGGRIRNVITRNAPSPLIHSFNYICSISWELICAGRCARCWLCKEKRDTGRHTKLTTMTNKKIAEPLWAWGKPTRYCKVLTGLPRKTDSESKRWRERGSSPRNRGRQQGSQGEEGNFFAQGGSLSRPLKRFSEAAREKRFVFPLERQSPFPYWALISSRRSPASVGRRLAQLFFR